MSRRMMDILLHISLIKVLQSFLQSNHCKASFGNVVYRCGVIGMAPAFVSHLSPGASVFSFSYLRRMKPHRHFPLFSISPLSNQTRTPHLRRGKNSRDPLQNSASLWLPPL